MSPRAGTIDFCVCQDLATLTWMAQLAALELHPSLSLAKKLEQPTVIAFDLDPGPPASLLEACQVGLRVKALFEDFGLESFPKASGKGLQVYVPLNTKTSYDETKPFAQAIAKLFEAQTPKEVVARPFKKLRRGKVFLDWSQNHEKKTTVAAYSLRARERPIVVTPLRWAEVERAVKRKDASKLVLEAPAMVKRLAKEGDLFAPVLALKQKLPKLAALDAEATS
jgi:bifunctional non-homologous end joining protein LigD